MAESVSSGNVKTGGKNVVEVMHADLTGGRELDMTGVTTEYDANDGYIPEGTPIILDTTYKPLLAANKASGVDGPKTIGILFAEVHKDEPYASICIQGVVNTAKLPFVLDATSISAMNGIEFI